MKKFLRITIISILLVLVYSTIVSALSYTVTMTPSSTTVKESTEFTVAIKVSNLDVGTNGINSLSGYLSYDTEIFETISDSSIEGLNGWTPTFNSENGKITLTKTAFVKSEESVFQITLKTKSGISGKTGTIAYKEIVASNSEEDITGTDVSTTITIGTSNSNDNNNNNNNNNNANNTVTNSITNTVTNTTPIVPIVSNSTTNTTTNTVRNTTNSTGNNVSSYVSSEDIPYTGAEDTVLYVMLVVLALAIIFYVKYQRINKDLK